MSGSVSGYISTRIAKFSGCKSIVLTAILTATTLPGFLVGMFTFLNIFLSIAGAATAVPFWLLLAIFGLWVCVSAPLVFVGAFFGGKATKIAVPVKTNQIARVIPEQHWYTIPPCSYLLGGILPFGSVCIELFFIMSAVSTLVSEDAAGWHSHNRLFSQLWLHQIYYVMGFLLAVLLILAATCAQVSIVMDYLQLCAEDHRWWWKSFFNCASAGLYLFLYSLWFLASRLDLVGLLPVVIYLTYMGMISLCFGLFCGSVGFICSFAFNRTIYGALKVD
jgi:transmembrane 9 superfamily member 2/4